MMSPEHRRPAGLRHQSVPAGPAKAQCCGSSAGSCVRIPGGSGSGPARVRQSTIKRNIFYLTAPSFSATAMPGTWEILRVRLSGSTGDRFHRLLRGLLLDPSRADPYLFPKGMKKQLWPFCGMSSNGRYLLCDETFDGLDPVMRRAVKILFAHDMSGAA